MPVTAAVEAAVTPADAERAFLSVDEAAALLDCDRKTVYQCARDGTLPGVLRLGRAIRISRAALLAGQQQQQPQPNRQPRRSR